MDQVDKIKFPFVTLSSQDDMICSVESAPLDKIHNIDNWAHIETRGGGHTGFSSGLNAETVKNFTIFKFFLLF